jgi:integrase
VGLTVKQVARLVQPGRYFDGNGLVLQIVSETNRSWLFRYQRNGRERWLGLGPTHTIDLVEARERARKARQQLLDGIDPVEQKKAEKVTRQLAEAKALSFEQAATAYYNQHEKKWKNAKHRAQFLSTLKEYVFPTIGKLPVGSIDTPLVLKCLEPMWATKTETASRVRGRIESVLGWATVRQYRSGDNPARWKGHLSEVLPARSSIAKAEHHPALPYDRLPEFMAALKQREGAAARALEFTILTAARTGEVIGARWDEINLDDKIWTVPANRIKGGKEHRVPLSDAAVAILESIPTERGNEYVFIGPSKGRGLSNMAMASVLKRMNREEITVHGFRSSFRDWAAERTNYQNHIVEMALAHVVGNAVEAAYRRGDMLQKRQRLMSDWAQFCMSPPAGSSDNVTPLRVTP